MSLPPPKILFLDRDGTLVQEPPDEQLDSVGKFRLVPGTISALRRAVDAGYRLVMVSNQDGLGTDRFPQADFDEPQRLLIEILQSEGIVFSEILIDPHFPDDGAPTRKPGIGMVRHYLKAGAIDLERSAVVGDRATDAQLADNMGVRGFLLGRDGDWPAIMSRLLDGNRTAAVRRETRETRIQVDVDLDRVATPSVTTGIGFLDHMIEQIGVHGGFALTLRCDGDLHVDEHHTVEDSALALGQALREALGDRRGIDRYGFLLPMDEARAQVALDLSVRSMFVFEGTFPREQVGGLPTELVPHFFRSLADAMGATLHLSITGDNAHHMIEACFKSVGRTIRQAIRRGDGAAIPSSKGSL